MNGPHGKDILGREQKMMNDYSKMLINVDGDTNVVVGAKFPIREWTVGVQVEDGARKQLFNLANLPFIHNHIAVMPDVHAGIGATVGSVIPTDGAIIPAAVGVDISCGMNAVRTSLKRSDLPKSLVEMRMLIERAIPHGRTDDGGERDKGSWGNPPDDVKIAWMGLEPGYKRLVEKRHNLSTKRSPVNQLATLGTGNHFCECTVDEDDNVWFILHSGSRGIGARIGMQFIELAKQEMKRWFIMDNLPDANLSFIPEGTELFDDYIEAVMWCQQYAKVSRELMMKHAIDVLKGMKGIPHFDCDDQISCNHNYVQKENHFGRNIWVTRKGAISAKKGQLGIIPGSMGAKSFIVRGLGNVDSFTSASHGAGRLMSRTEAKNTFSVEQHRIATEGVECKKDASVIDETPGAYKDIDCVMHAQRNLVEPITTLKQIMCIKG